MSEATVARPVSETNSHWYTITGQPCHEVKRARGDGMRATTLSDARKLGLLPSVTNLLNVLAKPALVNWLVEQAVLACLTAPRGPQEQLDAFVKRVMQEEEQHKAESKAAMDLGSRVHEAIGNHCRWLMGEEGKLTIDPQDELMKYCHPVFAWIEEKKLRPMWVEKTVVGDGYAGTADALFAKSGAEYLLVDFKTSKTLPKQDGWPEHHLQLAAYAKTLNFPWLETANIYISTTEPGKIHVCEWPEWERAYETFAHLVKIWQWQKGYIPNETVDEKLDRIGL